jgi:hypothetical protein
MSKLPLDVLNIIAGLSIKHYRLMLCIPRFARSTISRIHEISDPRHQYITPPQQLYWQHHFTTTCQTYGWYQYGKIWRLHYKIHRVQEGPNAGPSCILADGSQMWSRFDKLHRIQEGPNAGPAIIWCVGKDNDKFKELKKRSRGLEFFKPDYWSRERTDWYARLPCERQEWWNSGELHRTDGPAITCLNGDQYWFHNGLLHRFDGPAHIIVDCYSKNYKKRYSEYIWYIYNGKHRIDGPAFSQIATNGDILMEEWYQDGQLHRIDGPARTIRAGEEQWWLEGLLHRPQDGPLAGPAIINANGTEVWYMNGKRHRDNGPAEIRADGTEVWYMNGFKYRDNGPAEIRADGTEIWYMHNRKHRVGGPAVIYPNGTEVWFRYGEKHRVGGPAVIYKDGHSTWWYKGKRHRITGPAIEYPECNSHRNLWYVMGKRVEPFPIDDKESDTEQSLFISCEAEHDTSTILTHYSDTDTDTDTDYEGL